MQRNTRSNKNNQNSRSAMTREYAKPRFGKIDTLFSDVTITTSGSVTMASTGVDGLAIGIPWANFPEVAAQGVNYRYFEILGYKLDFSLNKNVTSFYEGAVAYYPVDYLIGETASSTAPSGAAVIMELPGSIWLQDGTTNKGQWCKPPVKQVYCTRAVGSNAAGNLLVYIDNAGSSEVVGGFSIMLNVRFYSKTYNGTS